MLDFLKQPIAREVITCAGHEVYCVGDPAQKERFAVCFADPSQNCEMVGRDGDRPFVNWAQVITRAAEQSVCQIVQIRVLEG